MTMTNELKAPAGKMILFGSTSYCFKCRRTSRKVIVRSRNGGFVSQDCELCGGSRYLPERDLPGLDCRRYARALETFRDGYSNYAYRCPHCRIQVLLADVVPSWQDLRFDYDGLAVESDFARPRIIMSDTERRTFLASIRSSSPTTG